MKSNADKCHLLVRTIDTVKIKIGNFDITNGKSEKLLGVKLAHKLSFNDHISDEKGLVETFIHHQELHYIRMFQKDVFL